MTTEAKNHIGHYFILTLIGLGVWLPISGIAFCIYVLRTASNLGMGGLTVVGTIFSLLCIEFVATGMLLIYAYLKKPWRLSRKIRTIFFMHALAAGLTAISAFILFLIIKLQ
ncbi:hypothetical protein BTW15_27455 [Pseudomonas syringae pv. tomato]|uniref:Lipoprotein n=2 Tax=Pseudomonas syringae group genomosp. 3 TaxID=251701 RepID=A0AB36KLZ2_PSEUB|nr:MULTISPECIES: hypothetical protein [Pseudomonas syringae group]MBI6845841.1 hypothetical protein [Pseudomonas syringae]MBX6510149.1 hypothetical protein [Pseudomonas syringae pv. tomato]MCF5223343.1 hypothetical protein [Pseudomonas syringae]MCF5240740.1 hypothetical protein [Pseudomonas syringae]OPE56935.1 hypothetical protein BTW15_27455 [Pseudomonas syringae pv. tomato]